MARLFDMRTPRVIFALILREMSTTYGKSVGGYLWAILEPAAGIALLTFVFSLALRAPPIGTSFALFYATGIVPFFMYSTVQTKTSMSINFSKRLLSYPRVTFFDAVIARFLLNGLTQVVVAFILLGGIILVSDTQVILDFERLALGLLLAMLLGLGVGSLNCLLFAVAPVWNNFWKIVNRPLFILSGIFYTYEEVPAAFQQIIWWNPLIHVIGVMRSGIYPTYVDDYVSLLYVILFASLPGALGLFLLRRYNRVILNSL